MVEKGEFSGTEGVKIGILNRPTILYFLRSKGLQIQSEDVQITKEGTFICGENVTSLTLGQVVKRIEGN